MMIRLSPLRAACAALAALALAGCGGGTQVEQFQPTRIIVFGDETSLLLDANNDANARKYTINALKTDNVTLDCGVNPIWVQTLAASYGLVFPECNPNAVSPTSGLMYAKADARSADVATQVATHLQTLTFSGKDLVTMLAGANDIIDQYEAVKAGGTEADAVTALQTAGAALAAQVNDVATRGGKVLISLVPDMGLTPYARTEDATVAGRAALLTRLTNAFNQKLRLNLINDGHMIGLLLTEELVQSIAKNANAASTTYIDASTAACDVALAPQVQVCTTLTLVTGATSTNHLWADDRHLSAGGQLDLARLAISRATGNPF